MKECHTLLWTDTSLVVFYTCDWDNFVVLKIYYQVVQCSILFYTEQVHPACEIYRQKHSRIAIDVRLCGELFMPMLASERVCILHSLKAGGLESTL